MEVEKIRKKNKRVIREDVVHEVEEEEDKEEKSDQKKLKVDQEASVTGGAGGSNSVVPTEEEVDEFFAILKRMKVAVKYFDDKGKEGGKEWREALEQVDVTVDDGSGGGVDGGFDNKKGGKVIINEWLDLNAVAPEDTESDGE